MRKVIVSAALLMMLASLAIAQDIARDPANKQAGDLLTVAEANHSISIFVTALRSSGIARMLQDQGPLTVFALSNQAFANLPKRDLDALLTNQAAMYVLLAHYIAHGSIPKDDTANLLSARTLMGAKLRTDIRSEGSYVNGAKLSQSEIRCTNGVIHVLDSFDPGLVHDAVALAKASGREK